jgi:hypothetical protein
VQSKGPESLAGAMDLEQAMTSCRICLVREKKTYQGGKVVFTLAIWTFSDDMKTRMEQKRRRNINLGIMNLTDTTSSR